MVAQANVPPEAAEILTTRVPLEPLNVLATGKAGSITATVMPFVFTLLLFLTIVSVSQALDHEHARGEGEPRHRGAALVA